MLKEKLAILKMAIQAEPATKYALVFAGIAAGLSIAMFFLGYDAYQTILAIVLALVAMTSILVFSWAVSRSSDEETRLPRLFLVWSFLLLSVFTAILGLSSIFIGKPLDLRPGEKTERTPEEELVLLKKREVLAVRGDWADMDRIGEVGRLAVARAAAPLGYSLLQIKDEALRVSYQIVKYQFASYAFMMAADVEPEKREALVFAERSIQNGLHTLGLIEAVLEGESSDEEEDEIAAWIREHRQADRTNFLLSFAFAVEYNKGKESSLERARFRLGLVSSHYKQDMQFANHRTLQGILKKDRYSKN